MSDLSLSLQLDGLRVNNSSPPPAKDCESIFGLSFTSFDVPYPLDVYSERKKVKPPDPSFYRRLRELRDADVVFVKPATTSIIRYIDQKCQWSVLNSQGEPIYFALDTTDAWASTVFEGTSKPFNVMILDYDYSEVLKITGPGLSRLHGSAWVKHSGKEIGRIVQEDHICSFTPTYKIEGVNEIVGLKVRGPPNSYASGLPNEPTFDIILPDENSSLMGRISKQWLIFDKEKEGAVPEDTYIVNYHQNTDLRTKCLLLSIVFMLDYQFYHKNVQGGVSKKTWFWFTITFFSLVIIILIAVDYIKEFQVVSKDLESFVGNISSFSTPISPEAHSTTTNINNAFNDYDEDR